MDEAYQRRGTAAQVGGVMSFKYHEMIRRFLMEVLRMTRHRNDLHAPTYEDIMACDKEIWHRLSTVVESLRMEEDSFFMPLDWYVEDILNHPQTTRCLLYGWDPPKPSNNPPRNGRPLRKRVVASRQRLVTQDPTMPEMLPER